MSMCFCVRKNPKILLFLTFLKLFLRLFSAIVCGNQLNAELGVWGFLFGSRQRLLLKVAWKVAEWIVTLGLSKPFCVRMNTDVILMYYDTYLKSRI